MAILVVILGVLSLLFICRCIIIYKNTRHQSKCRTLIVLGSGGHTAEMLSLLRGFDLRTYSPRRYVVAATDQMSAQKARAFEADMATERRKQRISTTSSDSTEEAETIPPQQPLSSPHLSTAKRRSSSSLQPITKQLQGKSNSNHAVAQIPRSREVGQSFTSSIPSTLYALYYALSTVASFKPDVVLVNGPGTCIPICISALVCRLLGICLGRIVYVESIARVYRLSLTGRILYNLRLADAFFVQWEELTDKYPRAKYAGRVM